MKRYKYIYGPLLSWRLGRSLGIDPVSEKIGKVCSFDCVYCQVGKTKCFTQKRKIFVPTSEILKEIKSLSKIKIDYVTFSGAGEPTLAKNLGDIIRKIKKVRKTKIAVITNSSLIDKKDVREDLKLADLVMLKLDAPNERIFRKVSAPTTKIKLKSILKGLKKFRSQYKGKFNIQVMFVRANKAYARDLARLAFGFNPNEVEINTPIRPSRVKPLSKKELTEIKNIFHSENKKNIKIVNVYDKKKKKKVAPITRRSAMKRRGRA